MTKVLKREKRKMRHKRVRAKICGTSERPRFSIFRSNCHLWAQLIDDATGKTVTAVCDLVVKSKTKKPKPKARETRVVFAGAVGELIAKRALEKKITSVVFDRGGYKYHGLVKAVAEGARRGGLKL